MEILEYLLGSFGIVAVMWLVLLAVFLERALSRLVKRIGERGKRKAGYPPSMPTTGPFEQRDPGFPVDSHEMGGGSSSQDRWDRHGFDSYGVHRETGSLYDPDGFDKYGYDREGYDREGFDFQGYNRRGSRRRD